jgi:NADH:ubiquinone oxidoreductase subunit H
LSGFISFELGLLLLLFFFPPFTSLAVYTVIIAGWSSNCGYFLLGGLRALAQNTGLCLVGKYL